MVRFVPRTFITSEGSSSLSDTEVLRLRAELSRLGAQGSEIARRLEVGHDFGVAPENRRTILQAIRLGGLKGDRIDALTNLIAK
jgi:hypothetical protein